MSTAATPDPMNHPDGLAWHLFAKVVAATKFTDSRGRGVPTFLSWASDSDTFGLKPTWPANPTGGVQIRKNRPTQQVAGAETDCDKVPAIIKLHCAALEDVRRNHAAFDYIAGHGLNTRSGLKKAFGTRVDFPSDTLEVKTNWIYADRLRDYGYPDRVALSPDDYFYTAFDSHGMKMALLSMHVISRLVPNWTWATFEHFANPGRCDIIGCRDSFGARISFVPPRQEAVGGPKGKWGNQYGECAKTQEAQALLRSLPKVFSNYCLKGTQTDFTEPTGLAIRMGNSITEGGFVDSSSCMTCHASAGWDKDGLMLETGNPIGPVNPAWFWDMPVAATPVGRSGPPERGTGKLIGTRAEFVWSIPYCAFDDLNPDPAQRKSQCVDAGE
jgi:hypothetical protein